MPSRTATRSALITMLVAVLGILAAAPASAQEKEGNSEAEMTLSVDCHRVEVTSSKDVSNVKVYFTDGTNVELHPNSPSFSQTFDKTIDHATAKSGTTQIGDDAGSCDGSTSTPGDDGGDNGGGGGSGNGDNRNGDNGNGDNGNGDNGNGDNGNGDNGNGDNGNGDNGNGGNGGGDGDGGSIGGDSDNSGNGNGTSGGPDGELVAGSETTAGADEDGVDGTRLCPAGTPNAGEAMSDMADCGDDQVLGGDTTAAGAQICPSGPYAGMPFMTPSDCGTGRDQVLAQQVLEQVSSRAEAAASSAAAATAGAAPGALPVTGGPQVPGALIALTLMGAGAALVRRSQ